MAVDTQTVTLGTSGNFVGYSSPGPVFGSISDGSCNFKSGAAYEGLYWDSANKYLRLQINSTSQLSNAGFGGISFPDGDFYPRIASAISFISYISTTQWLWSGVTESPWGGSTSGSKVVTFVDDTSAGSYGFQVFNSSNVVIVDSVFDKQASAIVQGSTFVGANATSGSISCPGMTTTNSDEVCILFYDEPTSGATSVTVTRSNGSFTLTNPLASSATIVWVALRY